MSKETYINRIISILYDCDSDMLEAVYLALFSLRYRKRDHSFLDMLHI